MNLLSDLLMLQYSVNICGHVLNDLYSLQNFLNLFIVLVVLIVPHLGPIEEYEVKGTRKVNRSPEFIRLHPCFVGEDNYKG